MLVELAFETFHESVDICPAIIALGKAVNVLIVGA
jgi:hypothetical protein